jgi:hypothetical protein
MFGNQHPHIQGRIAKRIIHVKIEGYMLVGSQFIREVFVHLDLAFQNCGAENTLAKIYEAAIHACGDRIVISGLGMKV